ncbi:MAG: hypothetical protein FJX29_05810 [Alphaproteobacteria bacterium]|nr:hypothetical protein [Alphaproteobacteria bacterium]
MASAAALLYAAVSAPVHAADLALGEYLSQTCVTCHLKSGEVQGGVPPIVGWPADQFVAVMDSYKKKERENEVMRSIASPLSGEDIAALAAYFATLKPAKP